MNHEKSDWELRILPFQTVISPQGIFYLLWRIHSDFLGFHFPSIYLPSFYSVKKLFEIIIRIDYNWPNRIFCLAMRTCMSFKTKYYTKL